MTEQDLRSASFVELNLMEVIVGLPLQALLVLACFVRLFLWPLAPKTYPELPASCCALYVRVQENHKFLTGMAKILHETINQHQNH